METIWVDDQNRAITTLDGTIITFDLDGTAPAQPVVVSVGFSAGSVVRGFYAGEAAFGYSAGTTIEGFSA